MARRLAFILALSLFATCSKTIPIDTARAAEAAGDAALGESLVQRWCVSCHGSGTRGSDTAPPLAHMLRGKGADEARLRGWLFAPHPPMQGLTLSAQQSEDVIAYLRRLARE